MSTDPWHASIHTLTRQYNDAARCELRSCSMGYVAAAKSTVLKCQQHSSTAAQQHITVSVTSLQSQSLDYPDPLLVPNQNFRKFFPESSQRFPLLLLPAAPCGTHGGIKSTGHRTPDNNPTTPSPSVICDFRLQTSDFRLQTTSLLFDTSSISYKLFP